MKPYNGVTWARKHRRRGNCVADICEMALDGCRAYSSKARAFNAFSLAAKLLSARYLAGEVDDGQRLRALMAANGLSPWIDAAFVCLWT